MPKATKEGERRTRVSRADWRSWSTSRKTMGATRLQNQTSGWEEGHLLCRLARSARSVWR